MSSDLILMTILVSLVLAYVSVLIYINLASTGIPSTRIYRILVEVWVIFLLIVIVLALITRPLGPVPSSNLADEMKNRLAHWSQLSWAEQSFIVAGAILVMGLFSHLIWSLRAVRKHAIDRGE